MRGNRKEGASPWVKKNTPSPRASLLAGVGGSLAVFACEFFQVALKPLLCPQSRRNNRDKENDDLYGAQAALLMGR